jgi:acyl carrier protein
MANAEDFESLITDFLATELLGASGPKIDPDENLFVSGHVDSLGIMRLIAHLETELALEIPPADLVPDNFRSVRVMAEYLNRMAATGAQ